MPGVLRPIGQLAIAAVSPSVHSAVGEQRQAVLGPRRHIQHRGRGVHPHRYMIAVSNVGLIHIIIHAELAVTVVAPGKKGAISPERQHMAVAHRDIYDIC